MHAPALHSSELAAVLPALRGFTVCIDAWFRSFAIRFYITVNIMSLGAAAITGATRGKQADTSAVR